MQNLNYRLGLDLGTNSIGWAILELDNKNEPTQINKTGVRIFSDGRNPKDRTPLAVKRREAREMRRRRDRFVARKNKLINYLISINFMPRNKEERKDLEKLNPYELRNRALSEKLNLEEIARIFFHINQRRGFKSNRKDILSEDDKKKQSETQKNRNQLEEKVRNNKQTLGQFLYQEYYLKEQPIRNKNGLENRDGTRILYEEEFDKIVDFQSKFYQKISKEIWDNIKRIIFYQRDLKPQPKGICRFINKYTENLPDWAKKLIINLKKDEKGLPRALLALPSYINFRILSEVNNLKIIDKTQRTERLLTPQEKDIIIELLSKQKESSFLAIREKLQLDNNFLFNLESDRRLKLFGNETEIELIKEENFGKKWKDFSLSVKDEIVYSLLEDSDKNIYEKALKDWGLDEKKAKYFSEEFKTSKFKQGCVNLSKELLQKIVPLMQESKIRYDEAMEQLGISHSIKNGSGDDKNLKYYGEILRTSTAPSRNGSDDEKKYGKIANPTVHCALNQLRKVINELINDYGKPTQICVELARDLKISEEDRKKIEKKQKENQDQNKKIDKTLEEEFNQIPNYDNRLKFKLFYELEKANGVACCPFSGQIINITNLFDSNIQIEHILPFSKTFDDSFANKTLSYASINREKGNRSPYEAFGHNQEHYEQILNNSKNLPKNKSWRFGRDAMERFNDQNSFINRQLNDTRYLSKIAREYLSHICKDVSVANGKLTSILRHEWGLNSVLKNKNSSDKNNKQLKERSDHRHHAVDAIIIALTDRSTLQKMSRTFGKEKVEKPWENFINDAKKSIEQIVVSHKIDHSKNARLHEESYYKILLKTESIHAQNESGEIIEDTGYNIAIRKKLNSLKENQISQIRNETIRNDLLSKVKKLDKNDNLKNILENYKYVSKNNKETTIKNIRVLEKHIIIPIQSKKDDARYTKGVISEGNHHIVLWDLKPCNINFIELLKLKSKKKFENSYDKLSENEKIKFNKFKKQINNINCWISKDSKYGVSTLSYFDSNNANQERFKPHPAAKIISEIHNYDTIKFKNDDGEYVIAKVIKLVPSNDGIAALQHNLGGKDFKQIWLSFSKFKEIELRKLYVSTTGKIIDNGPVL